MPACDRYAARRKYKKVAFFGKRLLEKVAVIVHKEKKYYLQGGP
jgi:hypothetical protein